MKPIELNYGRLIDDFQPGDVYFHPWEVTLDDGLLAMFAASFLDPNRLYSSRPYARALGFRDRVVNPLVLINLTIGYSVHDVSEQALAHLAYIDVRFPNPAYTGDTLRARSTVLGARLSESRPDRGVVHVRTEGLNQDDLPVIVFERKALIPSGKLQKSAHQEKARSGSTITAAVAEDPSNPVVPSELKNCDCASTRSGSLRGFFEDFEVGDVIFHQNGRTIGESEHMQLTMLSRNSHPLHFDEIYSKEHSIAKTRLVCGPLVFAWIVSLASRDTTARALWQVSFDNGSHPAPVFSGDTLFAASRVIDKRAHSDQVGLIKFKLVGLKNVFPSQIAGSNVDPFEERFEQKVFETERTVLVPTRD